MPVLIEPSSCGQRHAKGSRQVSERRRQERTQKTKRRALLRARGLAGAGRHWRRRVRPARRAPRSPCCARSRACACELSAHACTHRDEDLVVGDALLVIAFASEVRHGGVGADDEHANDGAEDAKGGDPEGQGDRRVHVVLAAAVVVDHLAGGHGDHLLCGDLALDAVGGRERELRGGESARGDDGADEGLEEIGAHARDVADVVADVVRDDGRVVGVVLGDARLDLADKISADVGSLGVDAASDASEEGDARGAGAEAREVLPRVDLVEARSHVDQVHQGQAKEAKAGHTEAHDGARLEGNLESLVDRAAGGRVARLGRAHVRLRRDLHATPAGEGRERGAHQEWDARKDSEGGRRHAHVILSADEQARDAGEAEDDEDSKELVLGDEKVDRTLVNLLGEVAHVRVIHRLREDDRRENHHGDETDERASDGGQGGDEVRRGRLEVEDGSSGDRHLRCNTA